MFFKLRSVCLVAVIGSGLALFSIGGAQSIVKEARLGNNGDDIDYVHSGPFANQLIVLDGYNVLAGPAGKGRQALRPLFDTGRLGLTQGARGIGYIESERKFVFTDTNQPGQIFLSDDSGNPVGVRNVVFPGTAIPDGTEAINYIPKTSPQYPDCLLEVIYNQLTFDANQIEIMNRDGTVIAEIVPDPEILGHGFPSASYAGPGRLLLGTFDGLLYLIDMNGHIINGPVTAADLANQDLEGVAALDDGRFVASSYTAGKLFFLDSSLARTPVSDISYKVGIGLSRPLGVAWNSDTNKFLFIDGVEFAPPIASVPTSLDSATLAVDLDADGINQARLRAPSLFYMPDEHLIGVGARGPRQLLLYDNSGVRQDTIGLSALPASPVAARYVSSTGQFAVNELVDFGLIEILNRDGTFDRVIDLSPYGIGGFSFAYFAPDDPSGGRFLALDAFNDLGVVVDMDGNLISSFKYRAKLHAPAGAMPVEAITSGPYAGDFVTLQPDNSMVTIFSMPEKRRP